MRSARPASNRRLLFAALFLPLVGGIAPRPGASPVPLAPAELLALMTGELEQAAATLEGAGEVPLYYLRYGLTDVRSHRFSATLGTVETAAEDRDRYLEVNLRVGAMEFDNTRESRTLGSEWRQLTRAPLDDDPFAIRMAFWERTEEAFRAAQERYAKLRTESRLTSRREDESGDFSPAAPLEHLEEPVSLRSGGERLQQRVLALSRLFVGHPRILRSRVEVFLGVTDRYFVDSEGRRVVRTDPSARIIVYATAKADDGMDLYLYETFDAVTVDRLPADPEMRSAVERLIADLEALREAPIVEPYSGPAILDNRAAGVFFHEVFGHRIEGHRQKSEDEGQTFKEKLGERLLPEFLDVYDDPTRERAASTPLKGHYEVDEEGVAPRRVDLVEDGVFRGFLMSRSPIEGFPESNGHGRAEPGYRPVARQGNLFVESSRSISYRQLRQELINLIREQEKPYGLIFSDISGGFTLTGRSLPQSFKVEPLLVRRVYADGRPDELVRGVDLVGTPLTSLSKIVMAGDDPAVFNGFCGAESGSVPVSAVAPSLLISEIEVEKQAKTLAAPPVLEAPPDEPGEGDARTPGGLEGDTVHRAMMDEMARTMASLQRPDSPAPYYLAWRLQDRTVWQARAAFGALYLDQEYRDRLLSSEVRVGDHLFDNTGFVSLSSGASRPGVAGLPDGDGYAAVRRSLWLAADAAYRSALAQYTAKETYVRNNRVEDRPPDFSQALARGHIVPGGAPAVDRERWRGILRRASAEMREEPAVEGGGVELVERRGVRRMLNSEGSVLRVPETSLELVVHALGQGEDGAPLSAYRVWRAVRPEDLPSEEEVLRGSREVTGELRALVTAPTGEAYVGPVLFRDEAAPEFFAQILATQVSNPRAPLLEEDTFARFYDTSGDLTNRLNRRILPSSVQVRDDPLRLEWDGVHLVGHYEYDDEAVPAEPLRLVEDGWLRALPMSRTPTSELPGTNGHGRALPGDPVEGKVSALFLESSAPVSSDSLLAGLLELARLSESPYGLVVMRLHQPAVQARADREGLVQQRVNDALLASPMEVWRVFLEDGRRERVRGYRFEEVGVGALKDILLMGGIPHLGQSVIWTGFGEGYPLSVAAPDFLLEEAVLSPVGGRRQTARFLPRPRP